MIRFFYNPKYKYTNRHLINLNDDNDFKDINYENIDTTDQINGNIAYFFEAAEAMPSYLVELENRRHWFVSGITQLSSNKFQLSLMRDIATESVNVWKNEEAFIAAGKAEDYNKYKTWDLPYTNTKIKETKLPIGSNGTKSSFFVFYNNTQTVTNNTIVENDLIIKKATAGGIVGYDMEINSLADIPNYSSFLNYQYLFNKKEAKYNVSYYAKPSPGNLYDVYQLSEVKHLNGVESFTEISEHVGAHSSLAMARWYIPPKVSLTSAFKNSLKGYLTTLTNVSLSFSSIAYDKTVKKKIEEDGGNINTRYTNAQYTAIKPFMNKIIKNKETGEIFKLTEHTSQTYKYSDLYNNTGTGAAFTLATQFFIKDELEKLGSVERWSTSDSQGIYLDFDLKLFKLKKISYGYAEEFEFTFKADNINLPKSSVKCVNLVSNDNVSDDYIREALMNCIINNQTEETGRIIDVQFLPFSIATSANNDFKIKVDNVFQSVNAQYLISDEYTFNNYIDNITLDDNIDKETKTCKIVSPSRATQFLFKPYNNGGNMSFNLKINIKPWISKIYIRPTTTGLLMQDWDDKDCFIMEEDCSLSIVNNAWRDYVYQNRNYNSQFERQMQGREFERGWEREVEKAQAKSDAWNARNISAQKAQTYTGGLPLISSISGAIGTAWKDNKYMAAAQLDRQYNEALYQESINIATDMFQYQIDNIKSQPSIPSKITTLDNKLLDGIYIEEWDTNETERQAIANFYKYNGHRIDCFGTFDEYWHDFVKGKIIISENFSQPEINELNRRLDLGLYTKDYQEYDYKQEEEEEEDIWTIIPIDP